MTSNPTEPGAGTSVPQRTCATRWLFWSGVASLAVAALCLVFTVVGMIAALISIANDLPQLSDPDVSAELAELQPYDLSEYDVETRDFLPGLGGRWFTVRFTLRAGESVSREDIRSRIATSLESHA